jgi:hypothetical protein
MTTVSEAHAFIRSRLEGNTPVDPDGVKISLRWRGEDGGALPDTPAPFAFTTFDAAMSGPIEMGGGRGRNRHRQPSSAEVFIFVPNGWGLKPATDLAEAVATLYRAVNESGVTVDSATVYPGGPGSELSIPGLPSEVENYIWSAVGIEFHFDLIG